MMREVTKQTEINRVRKNRDYLEDYQNKGESMEEYLLRINITELEYYKNMYGKTYQHYKQVQKERDEYLQKYADMLRREKESNKNIPVNPPSYQT